MAKLNVKHFNKIIKWIDADVNRLWMPWWGLFKGQPRIGHVRAVRPPKTFAECDTACCFGGWSHVLAHPRRKNQFGSDGLLVGFAQIIEARRLGLEREESQMLFRGVHGTRKQQWTDVKDRLRVLISSRLANGERSASLIRVPK